MARLPDPPLVSEPVRSDDDYRRLFWVSVGALAFVTVCTVAGLLPVTSLAVAVAICAALCSGRAQAVRRAERSPD
jgi:Flp pilus assembly protein TadB